MYVCMFVYSLFMFLTNSISHCFFQMLEKLPNAESLKDTVARSSVYWDNVLAPKLEQGKTLLIVGHENNLRSLIMKLEGISQEDIIHLNIPRAIPLAYRLDENLQPLPRSDGKLDEATGFLRGEWLGGDSAVKAILDRDYTNVYDTNVTENLETAPSKNQGGGRKEWMEFVLGKPTPDQSANGCDAGDGDFVGSSPVPGADAIVHSNNITSNFAQQQQHQQQSHTRAA